MPTKSFSRAPKPPFRSSLEDFEKRGRGHDTVKKAHSHEPVARFTIDMPRELHKRFKSACGEADTSMKAEILLAVEKRIVELQGYSDG